MFEDLLKELQAASEKISQELEKINNSSSEDDAYGSSDIKNHMWSSVDAIKGYSMFRSDLLAKPFNGAFPDVFKPEDERSKEEENMLKKYIFFKGLNNII